MDIGFDIINDLYLEPEESFNWENKATSLYCIVSGNVSSDMRTLRQTLAHLSHFYQGIFYIDGPLEFNNAISIGKRYQEITNICRMIHKVVFLRTQVIIMNGIGIIGANGWFNHTFNDYIKNANLEQYKMQDLAYLLHGVKNMQIHNDVKKILIVSGTVPNETFYFGEEPESQNDTPLDLVLKADSMDKIKYWSFGSYKKIVDTKINDINYINNPYIKKQPFYAKRVALDI